MTINVGTSLGRYEIRSQLGAGGMGEVYLAEDTVLDRRVAIKFLPEDSVTDQQAKRRLIREAQAAAKLDHPNICTIYEVGEEAGRSFIVMQYVEGETLASRIKTKPLDLKECLEIAAQVADALAEAHSQGVIHRDIKPQNIMLSARHQAKVMDFGLAKVVQDKSLVDTEAVTESLLTVPGTIVGTVPYMSPEQVRGEGLDARSDIFSFGAVLYEMVTGHEAFAAESAAMTISAIASIEPAPLARYSRDVPSELERIVTKALHKDREERYQTTRDLLIDLRSLKHHLGSWVPYFYNDKKRTFFVLPLLERQKNRRDKKSEIVRTYYPEIKNFFRQMEDAFEGIFQTYFEAIDFSAMPSQERQALELFLYQRFSELSPPPFTDQQVEDLLVRWYMRFAHWYLARLSSQALQFRRFHFKNFYHPFVCDLAKLVYDPLKGIPALMSRETQLKNSGFSFRQTYQPTYAVVEPGTEEFYPQEVVDFTPDGAYSPYNWELFFHAPLLIANSLSKNQRFEEARDWYHFIFNPIGVESAVPGGSPMSKYWITKPFFQTTDPQYVQQRIENIMRMLAGDTTVPGFSDQAKKDLGDQVLDWRTYPFEPHRIANYRTVAYQKTVVMKYLDNLIAWGDYLFGQDSMESINEATQLYILAAEILGPRPQKIPPQAKPHVESFNELEDAFDAFSNALVEVENLVPPLDGNQQDGEDPAPLPMLYFCIPQNDKLLGYWDTVADRLYKIRHCMNIEGVVRQLALFEPPIDPAALVKAVAGGLDISSALADLNAPLPLYRFNVLLQKANEVCNDVKALGGALLAALEKKDAEALALLRQSQEIRLLEAVKTVREKQIEEAKENLASVQKTRELAETKKKYYGSREFMNAGEIVAISLSSASTLIDAGIAIGYALAGGLRAVPEFVIGGAGFGGSPHATAETGGKSFGSIAEDAALTMCYFACVGKRGLNCWHRCLLRPSSRRLGFPKRPGN